MTRVILLTTVLSVLSVSSGIAQVATEKEKEQILERHNYWRSEVGVKNIFYSDILAKVAYDWAKKLQEEGCGFRHSTNPYGENLFKGTHGFYTVSDAIDSWADEKKDYDYKKNKCNEGKICGHYTQIVWETTTEVGCAKVICNETVIWVCNYNPPGNYIGQKPY